MCGGGGGGGGGDGGAAERKAAEDARQAQAIAKLNRAFGIPGAAPTKAQFTRAANPEASILAGLSIPSGAENAGSVSESSPYSFSAISSNPNRRFVAPILQGPPPAEQQQPTSYFDSSAYEQALADYEASVASGSERQKLYSKVAMDAKNLQLEDLNKEKGLAERDVNFDLARRGLYGGSREIDATRDIQDQFSKGLLTAENNAQGVANGLRQGDERTRVSLINNIRSGMGEADAASAAFNAMANNASEAEQNAKSQSIAGFFDSIRSAAQARNDANSYEQAFKKYQSGGGSSGSYGGSVQRVG